MAKGLSNTQRTLRYLREQGKVVEVVERRFPPRPGAPFGMAKDFLGIIDIIALDPEEGVVGIQSCGQAFSAHKKKIVEENADSTRAWLSTPGTSLWIYGWRKVKVKRGGKAMVWKPRCEEITLEDLE